MKFIAGILIFLTLASLAFSIFINNESVKKDIEINRLNHGVDSLKKATDSLYSELWPAQIELGRYQTAYEIFLKRNPAAASQYGDIISDETE